MQCKEWGDANSELFKEPHDEAVHENSYKSKLYELISASLVNQRFPDIIILHDSIYECIIARLVSWLKGYGRKGS